MAGPRIVGAVEQDMFLCVLIGAVWVCGVKLGVVRISTWA